MPVVQLRPNAAKPAAKPVVAKVPGCVLRGTTWHTDFQFRGRPHRESLRTTDAKEAALRVAAVRQRLERVALGVAGEESWQAAVVRWSAEVGATVKVRTAARYISSIRHFDQAFSGLLMSAVDRRAISDWVSARLAQGKLPNGRQAGALTGARELGEVTMAMVRRDLSALSSLMNACEAWGWLPSNPALDALRHGKERKRIPRRPPTRAEVLSVIDQAPAGMAGIVRLMLETGMRMSEASTIESYQVDRGGRTIVLDITKSSRPRALAWKTIAADAEVALSMGAGEGFLYAPEGSRVGLKNLSSNFCQLMRRLAREAAAENRRFYRFRLHDLRASFAVDWLRAGGDIYDLSKHLGHGSVKVTESSYLDWLTIEQSQRVQHQVERMARG